MSKKSVKWVHGTTVMWHNHRCVLDFRSLFPSGGYISPYYLLFRELLILPLGKKGTLFLVLFVGLKRQNRPFSLWIRGVHGSGRVRFVPDPEPTRIFRMGENQNRNRPILMVGLSGSGPSVFGFVLVGFGFPRRCRNFAWSGEIWSIFGRIRRIWTRSQWNIAGSCWIWWISSRTSLEKQKYRRYLSFFVEIPLNVAGCFDLMVGSGGSGFWGGNPPTDP